jgi:Fusaric acid resistance protein-like
VKSFLKGDLLGVHLAVNIFVATTALWLVLRLGADTNPIWAISAMIPAVDPHMKQALTNFRGRIFNALLGCATGLLFLLVGGASEWTLPVALSATVLLSSYVVRIPAMWRQAPITAAIIIAAGLTHHSKLSGVEIGLRRVGEVMLGCVMGLLVSWLMSKIWPLPEPGRKGGRPSRAPRNPSSILYRILPDALQHQEQEGCRTSEGKEPVDRRDRSEAPPRFLKHHVAVAQRSMRNAREVPAVAERG